MASPGAPGACRPREDEAVPTERVTPGPGQESVWDYPRPPRIEPVLERIRVVVGGETIADTTAAVRVLETAGAPMSSDRGANPFVS